MRGRELCTSCAVFVMALFLLLTIKPPPMYNNPTLEGEKVTAVGVVTTLRYRNDKLHIYMKDVRVSPGVDSKEKQNTEKIKGLIAYAKPAEDGSRPLIGSRIKLTGTFYNFTPPTNPGQFDMGAYYRARGVLGSIASAQVGACGKGCDVVGEYLFGLRRKLESKLDLYFSERDASIMKAMLLGDKDYLDEEVKSLFERAGCSHLLVISALHLSIIGLAFYETAKRILRREVPAALAGVVFIWLYAEMTGMGIAAKRAVIMYVTATAGKLLGRAYDIVTSMSIAWTVVLLGNIWLIFDSSFLLSFGAVMGIAVGGPVFGELSGRLDKLWRRKVSEWRRISERQGKITGVQDMISERQGKITGVQDMISEPKHMIPESADSAAGKIREKMIRAPLVIFNGITVSLSVTAFTLPIVSFGFFRFTAWSLILNVLLVPTAGVLLVSGLLLMAISLLPVSALGAVPALLCSAILEIYIRLCTCFTQLPGALRITGRPGIGRIAVYYLILVLIIICFYRASLPGREEDKRYRFVRLIAPLGVCALATAFLFIPAKKSGMTFMALDVGQGDSLLAYTEDGALLMDCGSTDTDKVGQYRLIPALKALGIDELDLIVVSHTDADHINGIAEALEMAEGEGIKIGGVAMSTNSLSSKAGMELTEKAVSNGIKVMRIGKGDAFSVGGMDIKCLYPGKEETGDANELSVVLSLAYGAFDALLTGDLEGDAQGEVVRSLDADGYTLYKAAHHGSRGSSSEEFLARVRPMITLISCGKDNSYGHPHREALERIEATGSRIYVTAEEGAISVHTDGRRVEMEMYGTKK